MLRFRSFLLLSLIFLLGTAVPTLAQDRVRESREVASFTEVALSIPGTLHLRQGQSRAVEVEATERVLEHVETTVEDGRLKVRDADNFFEQMVDDRDWGTIDVYVTAPTLTAVSLGGAGSIIGETPIEGESLSIDNAGSGTVDLEVSVTDLEANVAGAGGLTLRGTADAIKIRSAGSGTVQALDLETATAEVQVAGAGTTRLHVTDTLSADVMGSGTVAYRGSPETDTSILGGGTVRAVEE